MAKKGRWQWPSASRALSAFALATATLLSVQAPLHARDLPADSQKQAQKLPLTPLSVIASGKTHHFKVQVARTPAQQETGLMFRRSMPANEGMLFVFPAPKEATFWMENTPLPLDLLFIRSDGTIANIAASAKPMSRDFIPSVGRVVAVLELNGGVAARNRIAPGDRVVHADLR